MARVIGTRRRRARAFESYQARVSGCSGNRTRTRRLLTMHLSDNRQEVYEVDGFVRPIGVKAMVRHARREMAKVAALQRALEFAAAGARLMLEAKS